MLNTCKTSVKKNKISGLGKGHAKETEKLKKECLDDSRYEKKLRPRPKSAQ